MTYTGGLTLLDTVDLALGLTFAFGKPQKCRIDPIVIRVVGTNTARGISIRAVPDQIID